MSTPHDPLRAALRDLADAVEPADLHDRALRRSHRTGRREATAGTGAALVALGLLGSGLWHLPHHPGPAQSTAAATSIRPAPEVGPPSSPSTPVLVPSAPDDASTAPLAARASSTARLHKQRLPAPRLPAVPRSTVLADLPGHVFYQQADARPDVVRLSPGDGTAVTVLRNAPSPVGISPDGRRIAYVAGGTLLVGTTGDDAAEPVTGGVATADQAPAWSPDGARLLIDTDTPAVLEVASGSITPLPAGFRAGQNFRWSGDGSTLVYATAHCGLEVAGRAAASGTSVPVLGDRRPADNPGGLAACRLTSVDATGQRATVPLQGTGTDDTGAATADSVVDTVTGDLLLLPIAGRVVGAVFDAAGNLLVRTVHEGRTALSLFGPDDALLVQAAEPAAVRDLDLIAYTR
jgi:TolB protein